MDITLAPQDIKKYNGYIWKFFAGCFAFLVIMVIATLLGAFGDLPTLSDLEHPKSDQSTVIYTSDSQILGKWYWRQNRSSVAYKDISPNVVHALVAKEDNHFYSHSGIDFWRTFTIIPYNLIGRTQGASTLTQQLAKNQFTDVPSKNPVKRVIQKLKELIIAIRIEKHYTKEEIITLYLNTVDFGSNSFGISAAAHTYFYTTPDKLTPDQAATLVQTLTSTTIHSPVKHPETALSSRNFVLKRMVDEHFLSKKDADIYKAKPLGVNYHPSNHAVGLAPYFRAELKAQVKALLKEQGLNYDLDRDGLRIFTTIDANMQQYAEDAQREYMVTLQKQFNDHWRGHNLAKEIANYKYLINLGIHGSDRYKELKLEGKSDEEINKNFNTPDMINIFTWHGNVDTLMKPLDSIIYCKFLLRNALMSMDPTTGYIKAWVGGINFEHFKYDQVYHGTRQVGSTAKPFTYAADFINQGDSPCTTAENVPDTIFYDGQKWCPNSGKTETIPGTLTYREALAHSQNWITAHIMKGLTPQPVVDLIKKMGIMSDVQAVPSICIGSFNASVFDMTGAYGVFANKGIWTKPTFVTRIEDKNHHVLWQNKQALQKPVMDEKYAYVMTYMLKGVIEEGTGTRLRWRYGLTNPIGGKTGTTNDNSDGWFIGITPQLVTGVWTGCEDRDIHFRSESLGEGANTALPIFALYMQKVYANSSLNIKKNIDFDLPKQPLDIVLDCAAYNQQQKTADVMDKK